MTLADMLDPHWWTISRMISGFSVALFCAVLVKALVFES